MSRIILLFFLLLIFVSQSSAEICKWVDEDGRVNYGDCPSDDYKPEQIKIGPNLSEEDQQQAQERAEQLRQSQKQKGDTSTVESKIDKRKARHKSTEESFSNLVDKLGSEWTDTFEPISPRPLTPKEHKQMTDMFHTLARKGTKVWDGDIEEIVCKGPDDSPRRETRHHKVKLRIELSLDNRLKIDAEINSKLHPSERKIFLLLLKSDWLRFTDIDTIIQDDPRWDVEVISIGKNSLEFIRIYYGRYVAQHELRSINTSSRSFIIREWFYSQGFLTGMRTWKLKR